MNPTREPTRSLSDDDLAIRRTVFVADALTGQRVLITGGAGGIGRAVAWLFARLGAHVVIAGRRRDKLDALAAAMHRRGHTVSVREIDIKNADAVQQLFAALTRDGVSLDGLINCAGGQFPQPAIDYTVKGWNAVIDTNLSGTFQMMQAAARFWRDAARPGCIVNVVVVTSHGLYGIAHSVAARAGVVALSRSLAVEWAPLNIRINCVAPGLIETEGWNVYSDAARATYRRANPMMRAGTSWDIAEACAYLAGPSGAFVTGETLTVDGGGQHWGETWTTGKPDYFKE